MSEIKREIVLWLRTWNKQLMESARLKRIGCVFVATRGKLGKFLGGELKTNCWFIWKIDFAVEGRCLKEC